MLPTVGFAQNAEEETHQPKVALVLSGGGAKGFAHIGVLKVLEQEGFPIDIIVGTSIGGLIGGTYAIGYNASDIENLAKSLNWENLLSGDVPRVLLSKNEQILKQRYAFSLPANELKQLSLPQGLIKGQNVLNLFCGLAGNVPINADFEKFRISFACVATNLENGKEVVLNSGFLPTAMFSSMAIPIAFKPIGRDGLLLVDGGLANNFPTDVAKRMGADIIIGVDITGDNTDQNNLKSINDIIGQLVVFMTQQKDSSNKLLCNLIIRPDISGYSMSSFNSRAVDSLIVKGENAANDLREQLRELKAKYKLVPHANSVTYVKPDYWNITDLTFSGDLFWDDAFLRKRLNMKLPGNFSPEEIKSAIDRLYGLGGFDKIYYNLIDTENGKCLNLNIVSSNVLMQSIGFKINTTDAAAILFNVTRKNYKNKFGLQSASVELSANPGVNILVESNRTNVPTLGINVKGKYQRYDVFDDGVKLYKATVFYSSGSIYMEQPFLKNYNLGIGLQEEYYLGDVFFKNDNFPTSFSKTDVFITSAYAYLSFDNMDDYYYPDKGTNFYAEVSLNKELNKNNSINPIILFKNNNVIPIARNFAFLLNFSSRFLLSTEYPITKTTMVGGEQYSQYFNYHLPFVGLSAVNIAERYTSIGLAGLRIKLFKVQYISLLFNSMFQCNDLKSLDLGNMVYGGGIRYSMKTFLGPLDMTLGFSDSTEKHSFSVNLGYWF
jgi:NTE family protein